MTLIVIRETVPEKTWAAAFPGGDKSYWLSQTCLISPRQAIFGILSSAEKPAWNAWRILKWRQKKQPFWKILSAVITAALALFLNAWHRNGQSVIQYYYHSLSLLFKVELLHSFEQLSFPPIKIQHFWYNFVMYTAKRTLVTEGIRWWLC